MVFALISIKLIRKQELCVWLRSELSAGLMTLEGILPPIV
jgi:hypothetical protein